MKVLVTGSSGHLGEGLMRSLPALGHEPIGLDMLSGPLTQRLGSIIDRSFVRDCLSDVDSVIHAATLHKPHVVTHSKQDFVDTNITGTLNLLEEAVAQGVTSFVFTSTTSAFGAALAPPKDAPAVWIDETVRSVPKNIYGVTKAAAEDHCELFSRRHGLNCIILRTSRFFPEEDDSEAVRNVLSDTNAKANEFLFRRVDLEDAVTAHVAAMQRATDLGFGRYIISATTPFSRDNLEMLRRDAGAVVTNLFPEFCQLYREIGFSMFPTIDRVYANASARSALEWEPTYNFDHILHQLSRSEPIGSALARTVGAKGYHAVHFDDGPYPVD